MLHDLRSIVTKWLETMRAGLTMPQSHRLALPGGHDMDRRDAYSRIPAPARPARRAIPGTVSTPRPRTPDRARAVVTATLAHELRTPLTILKARLHGLEDGVIDPADGEAGRLLRQVDHILHLVNDLGALASAEAGALTLDRRPLDLADVLRAVVAELRAVSAPHGIRFREDYVPAVVDADPARLKQLFTNILSNAIKHSPRPGGLVSIALEGTGDAVCVRIADEGPGFAHAEAALLFEPFWRSAANDAAGRPGDGLGLGLAATLARAHGGTIGAANRTDRSGACFSIHLPLAKAA